MSDYLREVGRTARILAIVGLSLAIAVLAVLNLLLVVAVMGGGVPARMLGPLVGSALLFGFLIFASTWMLLQLLQGSRSRNQTTMMPVWFVQMFGILLGAGSVFAAVAGQQPLFVIEGLAVSLTMIFLPRRLRRSRRSGDSNGAHENAEGEENAKGTETAG